MAQAVGAYMGQGNHVINKINSMLYSKIDPKIKQFTKDSNAHQNRVKDYNDLVVKMDNQVWGKNKRDQFKDNAPTPADDPNSQEYGDFNNAFQSLVSDAIEKSKADQGTVGKILNTISDAAKSSIIINRYDVNI